MFRLTYLFLVGLGALVSFPDAACNNVVDSLQVVYEQSSTDSAKMRILSKLISESRIEQPRVALTYTTELEELAQKNNSKEFIGEAHFAYSQIYYNLGLYETSHGHNEKALELYQELNDTAKLVRVLNNIGTLYWATEKHQLSFEFYRDAYTLCLQSVEKEFLAGATMNMGIAFRTLGELDSAISYYKKGLEIAEEENDLYGVSLGSMNIGFLYLNIENNRDAYQFLNKSYQLREYLRPGIKGFIYNNLGRYYAQIGNAKKARLYIDTAVTCANKSENNVSLKDSYLAYFELDTANSDYERALLSYMKYSAIKDSLHKEDLTHKLTQFQSFYELDKKDSQLEMLQRSENLFAQKIRSQRIIIFLTIVVAVLATVLSFILFYYFKQQRTLSRELKEKHKNITRKNTTLLKREKELSEANESKSKLFSIIAHDIKNPLYAMLRLGDMLEDKYDKHSDEKRKEYLKYLNQAGRELVNLTENLLSWSRYQLGNIKYNPNYFSVVESVEFAVGFFRHMASLKDIDLQIKVPVSHMVYGDMSMVILVMRNLANNAVKFTNRKGCIQIVSEERIDDIKISIIDNGIGISKEQLKKMFVIEIGASQMGTEGEKGSGLGLALCKEFVEKNKGTIGVESKSKVGSRFWFTLPKEKK